MKRLLIFVILFTLVGQAWAQSYQAKNAMRTPMVPVPKNVIKAFNKKYPKARVDSCYVYESNGIPEGKFMFYAEQKGNIFEASFDKYGSYSIEQGILIKNLPTKLQRTIANNDFKAEGVGKVFKTFRWFPKWKNKPETAAIEYIVEFVEDYYGKKKIVYRRFDEDGYQVNPPDSFKI